MLDFDTWYTDVYDAQDAEDKYPNDDLYTLYQEHVMSTVGVIRFE